jgi:hypothetical protein
MNKGIMPSALAILFTVLILAVPQSRAVARAQGRLDEATAAKFAGMALACVHKEYPNKIAHVLNSDRDVQPPRLLTPAFYGCFDWHSCVHGHWLLARLARLFPKAGFAAEARKALARSLTAENMAAEAAYMAGEGRSSFERPYGLAWLLQLAAELREWDDPQAQEWAQTIEPLENAALARLKVWLPKLSHPVRSGEHSQTAFALGLIYDWARRSGNTEFLEVLDANIRRMYLHDKQCPLNYEPSGEDFLSPCLAEADLVRRILNPAEFSAWLSAFLPAIPQDGAANWLEPGIVTDPTDGKLVHLDGLNLSRAWMLEGIVSGLPKGDPRIASLKATAQAHAASGLRSVTGEHYVSGHWLASFAVYLVSERGLAKSERPQ